MDHSADPGKLPTDTTTGGCRFEHELCLSYAPQQTDVSLHVLEFRSGLLAAVEELHIRRDAETRYEEQISKLVLEKQELEWQKESLQHQIDTMANQHTESLASVKKQFQAKVRGVEDEKGRHQLTAELKDKEINSLKEGLKLLQLVKYSLEKKLSELEQKLSLQSQSKDSHLNQLGEVERRVGSLSRQCALVKQAHEKLEQNVDEAMRVNRKLASVSYKQQTTISSLKQELEEVNSKLIKSKVSSVSHSENANSHLARELHIQALQQKLLMEAEINKKVEGENAAERAGKQEVMNCLQRAHKHLRDQTSAVIRAELELQAGREAFQALKREHEVMREEREATEDGMARLTERCTNAKTVWEKEKVILLQRIKSEQLDLEAVREAYNQLHQKHIALSSQAGKQALHMHRLELETSGLKALVKDTKNRESSSENIALESMDISNEDSVAMAIDGGDQTGSDDSIIYLCEVKDQSGNIVIPMDTASLGSSSQTAAVLQSNRVPPSRCLVAEEGPLGDPVPVSEFPRLGRLQDLAPSQTRGPDCLVVTESVDKLEEATGATGGQDDNTDSKHRQPSHTLESLTPTALSTTPLVADDHLNLPTISGATGGQTGGSKAHSPPNMCVSAPGAPRSAPLAQGGSSVSEAAAAVSVSGPENRSVYRDTDVVSELLANEDGDGEKAGGVHRQEGGGEEGKKEGTGDREGMEMDDGKKGEERGRLATGAMGSAERGQDGEGSREDTGETRTGEGLKEDGWTEEGRRDGAEGAKRGGGGGGGGGGRVAVCRPETDALAQTSGDNKPRDGEKSETLQGTDPVGNTQRPLAASQTPDRCLTLTLDVTENHAETNHMKERQGLFTDGDGLQNLNLGVQMFTGDDGVQGLSLDSVQSFTYGGRLLNHDGVQALARDVDIIHSLPATVQKVSENTMEESTLTADLSTPPSQPLIQSQRHSLQEEESTPTLTADLSTPPSQPLIQSQRHSLQEEESTPTLTADLSTPPSQPLIQSQRHSLQGNESASQSNESKEPEAADSYSKTTNPSSCDSNMKGICQKPVTGVYTPVKTSEPLVLYQSQLQESPAQENRLTKYVKVDSGACEAKVRLCGKEACDVTDQPCHVTDQPCHVTDQPCHVTDQPCHVTDQPCDVTDQPCDVTDQPCDVTDQPMEELVVKDTRPPYDSGVRITVENVGPLGCQASPALVDSALPDEGGNADASTASTLEMNGHQQQNTEKENAEVSHRGNVLRTSDPPSLEEDVSSESSSSNRSEQPPAEEVFGDIDYSALASNKKYRSSFEWARNTQRKEVNSRTNPHASALQGFGQGSLVPEVKPKRSAGLPGWWSPCSIPTFLKGNQSSRDPLVISKAPDLLLRAPSASCPAASTKRDQRGEWKAVRDTFRETATADTESNLVSYTLPASISSRVSRLSWQKTPGSAGSPATDFVGSSRESEEEQSFRAQINKIEQFLCAERLHLPKRRRTDTN